MSRSRTPQTPGPTAQDATQNRARSEGSGGGPQGPTDVDPIHEAEALRLSLREALAKSTELIRALKRHRKRSKLVESTLASLREIETLAK